MTTPALAVADVSKHHGAVPALRNAFLVVQRGTVHGLVGGNGAGKSSLVKILAGVSRADPGGSVQVGDHVTPAHKITPAWSAQAGLRFVHQDLGVFPDMTVSENLLLGKGFPTRAGKIQWSQLRDMATATLQRFDVHVSPDRPLRELTGPDRTLVAIARALHDQAGAGQRVIVLDEPTACLPLTEANRLLDALRRLADDGHSVILITHRLDEVVRVADAATVLRDGSVIATISRQQITEPRLIELISGQEIEAGHTAGTSAGSAAQSVLEVRHLSSGPLRDVSLTAHAGEVVGVAGLLGSGRSRLLRALFGVERIRSGSVLVAGREVRLSDIGDALAAGIAYVPEERSRDALFPGMTVRENLTSGRLLPYWRRTHLSRAAEAGSVAAMLSRYLIRAASDGQPITTLSGGNQQKAVLARVLSRGPRVMLLDEPSQGVDVHARSEIHGLVRQAVDDGATALLVSSDFEELVSVCDRVIVLQHGRVVAELAGPDITTSTMHRAAFSSVKEAV